MTLRKATAAATAIAVLGGLGTAVALSGGTSASFTDAEHSSPSRAGAASVVLGRDGDGPELGFDGLRPGRPQTVSLRIVYEGTVPAEVSLSVAPDGPSTVCRDRSGGWTADPRFPLTIGVGEAAPVSYCTLHDGRRLPIGQVEPGRELTVPVTLTLASDATPAAAGREELDSVTVHADGGFTDDTTGPLTISTADRGDPAFTAAPRSVELAVADGGPAPAVALDPADPAASARFAAAGATVALPAECVAAGIDPAAITEIVTLDPAAPVWDADLRRGVGSGPFLVLGTAGADTVVGSTGADCVVGGDGDDEVRGADGDDVLIGGAGRDLVLGGPGRDRLLGGPGLDDLRGEAGADVLDGGRAGATCDADPDDVTSGCRPAAGPAPVPDPAPPAPTTPPPSVPDTSTPPDPAPDDPAPPASEGRPAAPVDPPASEPAPPPDGPPADAAPAPGTTTVPGDSA